MWKIKVNCASMTIKTNGTSIYQINYLLPRPEKISSHETIKYFMTIIIIKNESGSINKYCHVV